jgi:predicted Zn finger-like uncharacterized protein
MLVTTCARCQARFRVTPQQLNARQGQVRCGRCQGVFNGFQALERFPDDDTGGRLLAEHESRARDDAEREATETAESFEPSAAPVPAPGDETPDLETVHQPPPDVPARQPARSPRAPRAPRPEPGLRLEPPAPAPLSRAWSFGVGLLSLVLLAELAFVFRGPVAQRYPALRPALEAACARLECTVPWARQDNLIKLEDSELLEVPGRPSEIALGARIRNLASVAQEYPHLELTLTDNSGQPAARRVLRPTDYLGRPLAAGEVIGPGVDLALQLRLETPRLKATGYELLLFYP